jgi:Mrp family chromosome partitioning ATPase
LLVAPHLMMISSIENSRSRSSLLTNLSNALTTTSSSLISLMMDLTESSMPSRFLSTETHLHHVPSKERNLSLTTQAASNLSKLLLKSSLPGVTTGRRFLMMIISLLLLNRALSVSKSRVISSGT